MLCQLLKYLLFHSGYFQEKDAELRDFFEKGEPFCFYK